jgi:hypothetical protein
MSQQLLRAYDYVTHPYDQVRRVLRQDALGLFQRATALAASRAAALHAHAHHASIGPLDLAAEVQIRIRSIEDGRASLGPATRVGLEWKAVKHPGAFPVMRARLGVYPLSGTETQLGLEGTYEAPRGLFGKAIDEAIGRLVVEAAVLRFIQEVAGRLCEEIGEPTAAAG